MIGTRILYRCVLPLLVMLLTSACNNDIFIDGPVLDEEVRATIDGDGGEAVFKIPLKGLESIRIDLTSEGERYCKYYNDRDEQIAADSHVADIAAIVFDNEICRFEVRRKGSKLTFRSLANPTDNYTWTLRLQYDYAVKFVSVEVEQGQPLKFIDCTYNADLQINDKVTVKTQRFGFNNNGPVTQIYEEHPYLNRLSLVVVEPDGCHWLRGLEITMPVPAYIYGSWQFVEYKDIFAGHEYRFQPYDYLTSVPVEIPPYSKINVFTDVTYARAQASGTLTFINVALKRRLVAGFTATSTFPTGYEIRVENAD